MRHGDLKNFIMTHQQFNILKQEIISPKNEEPSRNPQMSRKSTTCFVDPQSSVEPRAVASGGATGARPPI